MYVRGQERLVYETVVRYIKNKMLNELGWNAAGGQLPWGAQSALTFVDRPPSVKDGPVPLNTVAISEGSMPDELDIELGGMLWSQEHTFFIDVYGESPGIARSVAGDIRSVLTGRGMGTTRYTTVLNLIEDGAPPLLGHEIHFEDVELDFPAVGAPAKTHWVVVKATAVHSFSV